MSFYQQGRNDGRFDNGIEMALQRILADPEFVFRKEAEPANVKPGQNYRISDLELASRLSFFLWSSIPDDELITLAGQNKLHEPGGAGAAGAAHAGRSALGSAGRELRRAVAEPARLAELDSRRGVVSGLRRQPAAGLAQRNRAVRRQHRA